MSSATAGASSRASSKNASTRPGSKGSASKGGKVFENEPVYRGIDNQKRELDELERKVRVTELRNDDFEEILGIDWKASKPRRLDFSGARYELETLHGDEPTKGLLCRYLNKSSLVLLDVSNNRLHELSVLSKKNGFTDLKVVMARRNHILDPGVLELPKLVELNLAHNNLRHLPTLGGLPSLEVLVLSHNNLTGEFSTLQHARRLQRLDLAYNCYDLKPSRLQHSLEGLMELKNLTNLRLFHNPFVTCFPEYQVFVVVRLKSLTMLDDLKVDAQVRESIKLGMLYRMDVYDDLYQKRRQEQLPETTAPLEEGFPRMTVIMEKLEDILADPGKLQENVRIVRIHAQRCAVANKQNADVFWMDVSGADVVQRFLDMVLGIMERHDSVKQTLVEVLGLLVCIPRHEFGPRCMALLGEVMLGSEDAQEQVGKTLEQVVVPAVKATVNKDGKYDVKSEEFTAVVTGLVALMDKPELKSGVAQAIGGLAPLLLKIFDTAMNDNEAIRGIPEWMMSLKLLTACTDNKDTAVSLASEDLAKKCVQCIGDRSIAESTRMRPLWLDILKLCENIVRHGSDEHVQAYVKLKLHVRVILRGHDIWKHQSVLSQTLESSTLAAIFNYVTTLAKKRRDLLVECCKSHDIVPFICRVLRHCHDPKILAAAVRLITLVLRDDDMSRSYCEYVVRELSKLAVLMQYLGGRMYADLYRQSLVHSKEASELRQSTDGNKVEPPELESLKDTWVCNAFLEIIALIEFFAEDCEDTIVKEQKESVNQFLNHHGRETLLLKLLVIPNDDIKVEVMRCISKVPLDQIEVEEMGLLFKCLASEPNISEGRAEELLALLIRQLENLAVSPKKVGDLFREHYAKASLTESYEVLYRNAQRPTYGDKEEEEQKLQLSTAVVSMFVACSRFPELRTVIRNSRVEATLPHILKWEEEMHRPTAEDVSIETCWFGRSIEMLVSCFNGKWALDRHKKVAFRVLARIADIAQGMTDSVRAKGAKRIMHISQVAAQEAKMWDAHEIRQGLRHLDDNEWKDRAKELQGFIDSSSVEFVINYATNSVQDATQVFHRERLQEHAKVVTSFRLAAEARKQELLKEEQRAKERDKAIEVPLHGTGPISETERMAGKEALMTAIQRAEDTANAENHGVFAHRPQQFSWSESIFADQNAGIINPAYIMAACLRTLHALVVVPPTERCRFETVYMLRKPNMILRLLAAVEQLPVLACHVGSKFLRLMATVMDRANDCPLNEEEERYFLGLLRNPHKKRVPFSNDSTTENDMARQAPVTMEMLRIVINYVEGIAESCSRVLKMSKDHILDEREQTLCIEVSHFMATVITYAPGVQFSDHPAAQKETLRRSIAWLSPPVVIRVCIAMILYDLQMDAGGAFRTSMDEDYMKRSFGRRSMKETAARFLVHLLVRSPEHKYDVLEAFCVADVFERMTVRTSFVNDFLDNVQLGSYGLHIESLLPSWGAQGPILSLGKVYALKTDVKTGQLQGLSLYLMCIIEDQAFLLAPVRDPPPYTAPGLAGPWEASWEVMHPRDPQVVWRCSFAEISRIIMGYGTQILAIQWKKPPPAVPGFDEGELDPLTMRPYRSGHDVFIFQRAQDRRQCIRRMRRGSGWSHGSRAPIVCDPVFYDHVHADLGKGANVLIATVAVGISENSHIPQSLRSESEPRMYVLTTEALLEYEIFLQSWHVSPESSWLLDRDLLSPETQRAKSDHPLTKDPRQHTEEDKLRLRVHMQRTGHFRIQEDQEEKNDGWRPAAISANISASLQDPVLAKSVLSIAKKWKLPPEEIVFHTGAQPDLSLVFASGTVVIRFLDDAGREEWRRALAHQVSQSKGRWERRT